MHGWRGGAPCCADKLSATLLYSSLVFPFLPPVPPVDEPLRFVPLVFVLREGSTEDMPLVCPRNQVACKSGPRPSRWRVVDGGGGSQVGE